VVVYQGKELSEKPPRILVLGYGKHGFFILYVLIILGIALIWTFVTDNVALTSDKTGFLVRPKTLNNQPIGLAMRSSHLSSSLAVVTVLTLLASPVLAQNTSPGQPAVTGMPVNESQTPAMHMHHHMHDGKMHKDWSNGEEVETRIKTLHDKLGITPDQEDSWKAVAETMRDNEKNIHGLIKDRHENHEGMTAVDDLKSYEAIAKEHVDGLERLIPNFETLYDSMSDAQKANADKVFGKFEGHEPHKGGKSK
jgi:hypothetical protein